MSHAPYGRARSRTDVGRFRPVSRAGWTLIHVSGYPVVQSNPTTPVGKTSRQGTDRKRNARSACCGSALPITLGRVAGRPAPGGGVVVSAGPPRRRRRIKAHRCLVASPLGEPRQADTSSSPVWSRAYGAAEERYGYYSPALGPVNVLGCRGRAHTTPVRSSVALRVQRVGSTFTPRRRELKSLMESYRRASRGAKRAGDGGCRPTCRPRPQPTPDRCLGRQGFLGYPCP